MRFPSTPALLSSSHGRRRIRVAAPISLPTVLQATASPPVLDPCCPCADVTFESSTTLTAHLPSLPHCTLRRCEDECGERELRVWADRGSVTRDSPQHQRGPEHEGCAASTGLETLSMVHCPFMRGRRTDRLSLVCLLPVHCDSQSFLLCMSTSVQPATEQFPLARCTRRPGHVRSETMSQHARDARELSDEDRQHPTLQHLSLTYHLLVFIPSLLTTTSTAPYYLSSGLSSLRPSQVSPPSRYRYICPL